MNLRIAGASESMEKGLNRNMTSGMVLMNHARGGLHPLRPEKHMRILHLGVLSSMLATLLLSGAMLTGCGSSGGADTPEDLAVRVEEAYNSRDGGAYASLFDARGKDAEALRKLVTRQAEVEEKALAMADAIEKKYNKDAAAKAMVKSLRSSDVFAGLNTDQDAEFRYDEEMHAVKMRGSNLAYQVVRRDGVYYLKTPPALVLDDEDQMKKQMEVLNMGEKLAEKGLAEVEKQEYWSTFKDKFAEHERELKRELQQNQAAGPAVNRDPEPNNPDPQPANRGGGGGGGGGLRGLLPGG